MNKLAQTQPPFAQFLGLKITHVSPERVTAELEARPELNNRFGIMHGGCIMSLADNLGGTATTANLKARTVHRHDRKQDELFRFHPDRRYGLCRMHAAASRQQHHGLADPHHAQRRAALRAGDPNADRAQSREVKSAQLSAATEAAALAAAGRAAAPRLAITTPTAQTTMPRTDTASSFSPNSTKANSAVTAGTR